MRKFVKLKFRPDHTRRHVIAVALLQIFDGFITVITLGNYRGTFHISYLFEVMRRK